MADALNEQVTLTSRDKRAVPLTHDQWLAHHVMGWSRIKPEGAAAPFDPKVWHDPRDGTHYRVGDPKCDDELTWRPTERIEDAWMIVERLISLFGPFFELHVKHGRWECAMDLGEWDEHGNWRDRAVRKNAGTPAVAICEMAAAVMANQQSRA
jgi:hypothetical protein